MRVLVVEDDRKTAAFIVKGLQEAGFETDIAADGEEATTRPAADRFDIAIVDVMLPKKDGWNVVREWRAAGWNIPILFLTARDSVHERVRGLELGADDYLVKPFAFPELLARVRTLLRRTPSASSEILRVADLEIDTQRQRANRGSTSLNLTPKEFLLLAYLARSPGTVVSRPEIVRYVWDVDFQTETNVVDVVVRRLRAKVDDPFPTKLVHTIRGVGYVLRPG
jgi:two-component system, OmpR family, copper resistance phosphate regulon response regulator CusR